MVQPQNDSISRLVVIGIVITKNSYTFGMTNNYTAIVKQDGEWWIGWIEEVPGVNCQEATREELLESLRVTLGEALEFFRRSTKS